MSALRTVAALYVQTDGCYFNQPGVDPWDERRDARLYAGPHSVIGHPPCERFGRYARGGPNPRAPRREIGDDGGCFAAALASVRQWGGVLEHPSESHAWRIHGLLVPPWEGGWIPAGDWIGWTCRVEQGHYGHVARKGTWLYAVGVDMPELIWGASVAKTRLDEGWNSTAARQQARAAGVKPMRRVPDRERAATPAEFRDVLLAMARSVPVDFGARKEAA